MSGDSSIFVIAQDILGNVYSGLAGIITILCVVFLTICLIGKAVCKNQKTVDEFRTWQNRIVWAWVIFNILGMLVTYLDSELGSYKWSAS